MSATLLLCRLTGDHAAQEHKASLLTQLQDLTTQLNALQAQHTELSNRHAKLEQALVSQPPIPASSTSDQAMVRCIPHRQVQRMLLLHLFYTAVAASALIHATIKWACERSLQMLWAVCRLQTSHHSDTVSIIMHCACNVCPICSSAEST